MTARGPGGRVPPDGRPPVAPGVGKTARRHDLEAQPTPGLSDPSIQQGDVQRLEQAQQVTLSHFELRNSDFLLHQLLSMSPKLSRLGMDFSVNNQYY